MIVWKLQIECTKTVTQNFKIVKYGNKLTVSAVFKRKNVNYVSSGKTLYFLKSRTVYNHLNNTNQNTSDQIL